MAHWSLIRRHVPEVIDSRKNHLRMIVNMNCVSEIGTSGNEAKSLPYKRDKCGF